MPGILGVTENVESAVPQVTAGDCVFKKALFAAGTGTLPRGHVVAINTTTGYWEAFNHAGANGTNVARGVLMETITLNASATTPAIVVTTGPIRSSDLSWSSGITNVQKSTHLLAMQDKGLVAVDWAYVTVS